ncbi:MAG TPA: ATP-binding protein [Pseudolabrys sp.]|nr:ATP-binding protein [Pseudolabrys sp.]
MADLLLDTPLTPERLTYAKALAFALVPLVEETVELLAPRAKAKNIEIASFVDDRLPRNVVGDPARLRQVLLNLAGNAMFTEQGGVAVVVEPGMRANDIRFLVRDTGIGLGPQDQARVFRDFEQADGSSPRKFAGTGLGLAISKRIVERMDGRIVVDSQAGSGAVFSFSVPLTPAPGDHAPEFTAPDLTGKATLIVAAAEIRAAGAPGRVLGRRDQHRGRRGKRRRAAGNAALGYAPGRLSAGAQHDRPWASCAARCDALHRADPADRAA